MVRRKLVTTTMASIGVAWLRPDEQEFAAPDVRTIPQHGLRRLAIIVASVLAMTVDGTASAIVNAGLPYLQGITTATPDQASWIISAFNAPYYTTILFTPWLYARFGRKPLLLTGLIGFTIISLLLTLSTSYEQVVVLRFFQGLFLGTVYVPAALLLFTSLPLAALTIAIPGFALISLGAATIGSVVGGYFSENFGGNYIYLPGAAATLIAAALVYFMAPSLDRPNPKLRLDLIGFSIALFIFAAAQYLSNEGERRNWLDDPAIPIAFAVLAAAIPAFLIWELCLARRPHVNLRLFTKYRNLSVGSSINVVLGMVGYSVTVFILYLQSIIDATETLAGELIILRLTTYVFGIITAFLLFSRKILDVRVVVTIGTIGTCVFLFAFANSMTSTAEAASFILISLGFGYFFSMMSQPVPALVIGSLPLDQLPAALSIYKLTAPIGLMIATGALQTLLDHRTTFHATALAATVTRASTSLLPYHESGVSARALSALVAQQAQNLALADIMRVLGCLVLLVIPLVVLAKVQPRPQPPPSE